MKSCPVPWGRGWDALILAGVAFALRLGVVLVCWGRVPPSADGEFYHVVAQRIAQGDGYTWLWPDGVVTYAAHYPVGYPALMSVPYWLFGPIPGVVMMFNALLGALLVWLTHGLCLDVLRASKLFLYSRSGAGLVGVLLAFSPTLVGYTPALMTEGAVVAFLVLSAWCAARARSSFGSSRAKFFRLGVTLALGAAVLLRPQSILFAPIVGFLSHGGKWSQRVLVAALVSLGCLVIVLPWTLRNCDKMERCVFVSANGGWNLLIGTFTEGRGAWVALDGERVPNECREVYQEAAKDKCFGQAGIRRIKEHPGRWVSLIPAKLRTTLDFTAAAADHLVLSGALPPERKPWLAYPEFVIQRMQFLLALLGAWVWTQEGRSDRELTRAVVLSLGVLGFLGLGATWGWLACVLLFCLSLRRLDEVGIGVGVFGALATIVVHAVFFGAGRYALPLIPLSAPLAAVGAAQVVFLCKFSRSYTSRQNACAFARKRRLFSFQGAVPPRRRK